MIGLMKSNFELFEEYALKDAEIARKYVEEVIKISTARGGKPQIPVTLTSLGISFVMNVWKEKGYIEKDINGIKPERKHREIQTEKALRETPKHIVHQVHNHTTPQRKVRKIGEATGRTHFDRAERDYHGLEKPLEIATGGHRLRGLDFLIKSRS